MQWNIKSDAFQCRCSIAPDLRDLVWHEDAMGVENEARGQRESENSAPVPPPKARPHICSFCQTTFRRDEHLQRHVRCHTGEKKYRCPCGATFARNDVFVRHMRGCQKGLTDSAQRLGTKSMVRTKTKRACDECAKTKAKCDHQKPCTRCVRKSLTCEKTRNGYEDPYGMYRIQNSDEPTPSEAEDPSPLNIIVNSSAEFNYPVANLELPLTDDIVHVAKALYHEQDQAYSCCQQIEESNSMALTYLPSPPSDENSDASVSMPQIFTDSFLFSDGGEGLALELDPASIYFSSVANLDHLFSPQSQPKLLQGPNTPSLYQTSPAFMDTSFSLSRLDPLEAKCNQIIEVLKRSGPLDSEIGSYPYITRQNMVHLCHLYGRHFQHNLPIIHAPTFDMLKSPPILLLAMMLVGACYSEQCIPPAEVTKLAMQLLTSIAAEPHETMMECPTIPIIQAGILICCILTCSPDVAALKSVRICFARNISMCERAGLFESMDSIDYTTVTEETFDWNMWIEQESRRRIACEIFCQDMVHCIFLARTPGLDPRHFPMELPGYETCWEAQSAAECLHRLQTLPPQIRVSTAMGMLNSWPDAQAPLFEASGFGMHVLINGLHYLLHQASQSDMNSLSYPSAIASISEMPDEDTMRQAKELQQDLSGPSVADLADRIIKTHGSLQMKGISGSLNSWRTTWDLRNMHDSQREGVTFKGDPLPFWWLAKLYLVLHYYAHILTADSEFATSRAEGLDGTGKTIVQRKIVGWLSSFRGQRSNVDWSAESCLPDLMKPR